ncbi:porin [Vibrio gallicus]|uniref:porin n=1 Tax=Vibrio gallicus TaxID=190897 RepID=UPI0021C262A5|nr:porin [Vibrio gallicus]
MKKTVLASLVAASVVSAPTFAVELYNNEGSTFSIGGHVSANINGEEDGETDVGTNSPRINFNATQDIGNGFKVDAKGEWQLNFLDGGDETFTTRLGYVGVTHEQYGRLVAGTQWAPYYDVGGIADQPIVYANDFLYENHKSLGTARADKMLSYRKSFDLGGFVLAGGLGWQGDDGADNGDRVQVALTGTFGEFQVGYAFTTGKYRPADEDAMSNIVSAKYGSYGDGIFVAGVYAMNEYVDSVDSDVLPGVRIEDSTGYELIGAYGLDFGLNLIVNYEALEDDKRNETKYSQLAFQAEQTITPNFIGYAAYELDLGGDGVYGDGKDKWTIGMRYYL